MVPISLFACITDTSAVSSRSAACSVVGRHDTRLIHREQRDVSQPRLPSAFKVFSTASCSMVVPMRWRRPGRLERLGGARGWRSCRSRCRRS